MKVLAPAGNFTQAIKQIEAGAGELYLGGASEIFDYFTFGGRNKINDDGMRIYFNKSELKDIVDVAHQNDVTIMYTANLPFLAEDALGSQKYIKAFLEYIDEGIECGVDSIIVGDIGALILLKNRGYRIHLTASSYLEIVNQQQIDFFKELGVKRMIVSYQGTMEEVLTFCKDKEIEVEIFGHDGCSSYNGYCNFTHTQQDKFPCRNSFRLFDGDTLINQSPFLNAFQTCSICSLYKLKKAGVYAIKMLGRDGSLDRNIEITKTYSAYLNALDKYNDLIEKDLGYLNTIKKEIIPSWWERVFCKQRTCRYKQNRINIAYI